jgi:hypothetical protein
MDRNVSGIIDSTARIVAIAVPKRMPRYAGMNRRSSPTIAMPSVHQEMNVLIGVKPLVVLRPRRSLM